MEDGAEDGTAAGLEDGTEDGTGDGTDDGTEAELLGDNPLLTSSRALVKFTRSIKKEIHQKWQIYFDRFLRTVMLSLAHSGYPILILQQYQKNYSQDTMFGIWFILSSVLLMNCNSNFWDVGESLGPCSIMWFWTILERFETASAKFSITVTWK